jgi:purine-binding chemotaxis protein CheW
MANERQFCTFTLGEGFFGVEVEKVQEVLRYQPMTFVPLAPPEVTGLINLRGQIVTALDLRRRLKMADRPAGEAPMNVVIRTDDGAVSLQVDGVGDVLDVQDDQFEDRPPTMSGEVADLVSGIYKLPEGLLLVLDVERALAL